MNAAFGRARSTLRVYSSTTSVDSMKLDDVARPGSFSGRSRFCLSTSALNGEPSWKTTSSRRVKV
jgi:hypothetical protein